MVDWVDSKRSYLGMVRFPKLTTIAIAESETKRTDKISKNDDPISHRANSPPKPSAKPHAATRRLRTISTGRWMCVQRRPITVARRTRRYMDIVPHFALNFTSQVKDKRSIKRRRKRAAWDQDHLLEILQNEPW